MPIDTSANVALLIDADNASHHHIDPVLTVLAELGSVNVRRVYGNWRKPALSGWADMSLKHGLDPRQQFDLTKGKNATDMSMTIDAMDLLYSRRIEAFGLMSSDSDFTPLAMRLKQDGAPVYGFGTSKTPDPFRQACTRFIDVSALEAEVEERTISAPPPAIGKTMVSPETAGGIKSLDDPELRKLLVDAYRASKRDERGFVRLQDIGQRAGNRSSFDARNYGAKRLSDLFEQLSEYQTERRDGGQMWVKRVR